MEPMRSPSLVSVAGSTSLKESSRTSVRVAISKFGSIAEDLVATGERDFDFGLSNEAIRG